MGIVLKETGAFIGTIDLHKIDPVLKKVAIGYIIHKDYWNKGLTTEVNRAVIQLAFEKIGMNKLVALHDKDSPASGRVMQKSGMIFSHEEPYATIDKHQAGHIVTRVHYTNSPKKFFGKIPKIWYNSPIIIFTHRRKQWKTLAVRIYCYKLYYFWY